MKDRIEEVARAICKSLGEDPDQMVMPGITMPAGYTKPAGPARAWWTFKIQEAELFIDDAINGGLEVLDKMSNK